LFDQISLKEYCLIPVAKPIIGKAEEEAVLAALRSGQLAQGERVAEFERRFADVVGTKYAVAVSSGTASLHLALLALGIGPGDEVITSPFTFIASANSILAVGARPVFADIDRATYTIDPEAVMAKITKKTRAIMPVHLYGYPADMTALMTITRERNLAVIEDAAQAHGAMIDGKPVGSFGVGSFSFYPTKNIMSVEGGMVTTSDAEVADKVRLLRSHGQRERYNHVSFGLNLRMTDLHAAVGVAQIEQLASFTEKRRANAVYLTHHLQDVVETPITAPGFTHVYHQYTIRIPDGRRDIVALRLRERGVGTGVHYAVPVHKQPFYQELGYEQDLPNAERAAREVLCLPVHPSLTDMDLETIVREVRAVVREVHATC
jgi:dTDP-4-amino-4,6-dideoxygalactose transaminase